jgi:vitamin B12 transporter
MMDFPHLTRGERRPLPLLILFFGLGWAITPEAGTGQITPPPSSAIALDTLQVTGSRVGAALPLQTRGIQILDRETLRTLPARSVADALRLGLGVDLEARSPMQADLSLRGGTFEQVLVLVDGVRVSDPQTGHFHLDLAVSLDQVERIEILRGPAAAQYGSDAVGGVVHIITRSPSSVRERGSLGARLETGSFRTRTLALQGSAGLPAGGGVQVGGHTGRSDGHREGTEWEEELASASLRLPLLGGGLRAEGGMARRDFGAKDFYAPFPSVESTRTTTGSVGWSSGPRGGGSWRVETRAHTRTHDDLFTLIRTNPSVYQNEHRSTLSGFEGTLRGGGQGSLRWALGGDWSRSRLTSNALGEREEDRVALYGEGGWSLPNGLVVSAGLRHDEHERWGGFTSPSVGLALPGPRGTRLQGSWNRAFRGPSWTERFYADPGHIPNPDLGPERGNALEASIRHEGEGPVRIALTLFQREMTDLIDWARPQPAPGGSPAPWVPRNLGEARFRGSEVEAAWTPVGGGGTVFSLSGTLLSLSTSEMSGLVSKYALRPLEEQLQAGIDLPLPGTLHLGIRGMHGRRRGDDPFQRLDLRLSGALPGSGGIEGYLDLSNLLDSDHRDITGNPVAGRAFTLGLRAGALR